MTGEAATWVLWEFETSVAWELGSLKTSHPGAVRTEGWVLCRLSAKYSLMFPRQTLQGLKSHAILSHRPATGCAGFSSHQARCTRT